MILTSFSEDFRKEDLAAALLMMLVMDTIEQIHLTCVANGIRQAFLTGNFTTHPRIQQELTKWAIVNTSNPRVSPRAMRWKKRECIYVFY